MSMSGPVGPQPGPEDFYGRREILLERLSAMPDGWPFDLKPHQIAKVEGFREHAYAMVNGDIPNEGMSLDDATGSGKSRTAAAMLRLVMDPSMAAVLFTPNTIIRNQVRGKAAQTHAEGQDTTELSDYELYLPGIKVNEYTTKRKYVGKGLVAMNYQSLNPAIRSGNMRFIDPTVLVCDEGHHVDARNTWRGGIESIMPGRLAVRVTATSEFRDDKERSTDDLFPIKLGERFSLKEGIRDGVLSEVYGFLYDSKVRIKLPKANSEDEDYSENAIVEAIVNSPVNDLVMRVCIQEIEQGRRGIVQCVPGSDRAHSRILAELLSNIKVKRPTGDKMKIRVAHVDGDMPKRDIEDILRKFEAGLIDVLTHTSLIDEGFNSNMPDFTVLTAPTVVVGKVEQPIGRVVRNRPGKTATVHGFAYDIEGDNRSQVTIEHVLGSARTVINGVTYYGARDARPRTNGSGGGFDLSKYNHDPVLLERRIREKQETPSKKLSITRGGQEVEEQIAAPKEALIEGLSRVGFARQFHTTPERVDEIFAKAGIRSQEQAVKNGSVVIFEGNAGFEAMVADMQVKPISEKTDELTVGKLIEMYETLDTKGRLRMTGPVIQAAYEKAGIRPVLFFTDDKKIIVTYPRDKANVPLEGKTNMRVSLGERKMNLPYEDMKLPKEVEVVRWLNDIFEQNDERIDRGDLAVCMRLLARAIDGNLTTQSPYQVDNIRMSLQQVKLKPTAAMIGVMKAKGNISFQSLLYAANKARRHYNVLKQNRDK